MPIVKNYKAEKVSTETLAHKAMDVCQEMLTIMCERTSKDGEEDNSNTMYTNLRYFGTGQQLKISKVGDSLYSAINDVMRYVMDETVKQSDCDCRFQMPKHTSFIGQIVKNTTLEVIARNPRHQSYLNDLSNQTGKYRFDVTSPQFLNLYYDTILRLYERGYLFDDDPELDDIRQMISRQQASSTHDINGTSISVFANSVTEHRLTTRNRVIFPYIRRLLETLKASQVTKRRVDNLIEQYLPDEEILRAFQLKYEEFLNQNPENQLNASPELTRHNARYLAIEYMNKHFPKDKVDRLAEYIKDTGLNSRPHKRYITLNTKRPRTEELTQTFDDHSKIPSLLTSEQAIKPENVEAVMPGNVVLVASAQPTEQNVIMPSEMAIIYLCLF